MLELLGGFGYYPRDCRNKAKDSFMLIHRFCPVNHYLQISFFYRSINVNCISKLIIMKPLAYIYFDIVLIQLYCGTEMYQ